MKIKSNFLKVFCFTVAHTVLFGVVTLYDSKSIWLSILLFCLFSFLLTGLLFYFINHKVYKLIEELKSNLFQFNEGNFTSCIKVDTSQKDLLAVIEEYEKLKQMMNTWVYELLKSSVSIKASAGSISESSGQTAEKMKSLNSHLADVSLFFDQTTTMLSQVADETAALAEGSSAMVKSSDRVVKKVKEANQAALEGGISMRQVSRSMDQIRQTVSDTSMTITKMEQLTHQIEGITQTITSISNQTTMLALNASIESARAGESGKGFAVVANEVGKLSVETRKAAEQIKGIIDSIRTEVTNAVVAMKQVGEEVEMGVIVTEDTKNNLSHIIDFIENVVSLIEQISSAMEKQSIEIKQISKNTLDVSDKGKMGADHVHQIADVVELQMQTAYKNESSAKKLIEVSSSLETIMSRFDLTLGKQMLGVCTYVAQLYAKQNLTNEDLISLCKKAGLTELHFIDENGIVQVSSNVTLLGFQFSSEVGTQTEEFMRIIKQPSLQVNQKAAFRDVDGKLFKYTGLAMTHKKGIVQGGLDASKMTEFNG